MEQAQSSSQIESGGLPATLADGTKLALAFRGMRGENGCEILRQAAARVPGISVV